MILKVARLGHPAIRTPAQAVDTAMILSAEFQRLLDDMVDTMREYSGVGLAAPQVHLSIQVAVLEVSNHPRYPDMPPVPLTYLINPQVTVLDVATIDDWEDASASPRCAGWCPVTDSCGWLRWAAGRSGWMFSRVIFMPESFSTKPII